MKGVREREKSWGRSVNKRNNVTPVSPSAVGCCWVPRTPPPPNPPYTPGAHGRDWCPGSSRYNPGPGSHPPDRENSTTKSHPRTDGTPSGLRTHPVRVKRPGKNPKKPFREAAEGLTRLERIRKRLWVQPRGGPEPELRDGQFFFIFFLP